MRCPVYATVKARFLSTPSARRATAALWRPAADARDFYPRPPRGGRPAQLARASAAEAISIHALREEGDVPWLLSIGRCMNFYPRPPRGGRPVSLDSNNYYSEFLSTPSARRATRTRRPPRATRRYFYPRPPRGGRPRHCQAGAETVDFYPRPPRGGRPTFRNGWPTTC